MYKSIEYTTLENRKSSVWDYIQVLKPRETGLLTFIGVVTAIIAAEGLFPFSKLVLVFAAVLVASAGANGLTNYLDRDLDARMERTKQRALAARRIEPAEKVLPLLIGLTVIGLVLAWFLHPLAFAADLVGTVVAITWRKRVTCVFPQGVIASCAPVLMGWFAVKQVFNWEIALLCILIALWLPSHIWSIMVANRNDYIKAGICYFPVNRDAKTVVKLLLVFCVLLYGASVALYFIGKFGWLYLATVNILGILLMYAGVRLVLSKQSKDAWKMYKLSAFPYLGILFLSMCLDVLVLL